MSKWINLLNKEVAKNNARLSQQSIPRGWKTTDQVMQEMKKGGSIFGGWNLLDRLRRRGVLEKKIQVVRKENGTASVCCIWRPIKAKGPIRKKK